MKSKLLENITPGKILEEDFLKPMGLSQCRLANDIGVPARRRNEIVKGGRAITADKATPIAGAHARIEVFFS